MKIVDKSYKNMASDSRIIRLHQINKKLDICFDYNDDDEERRHSILGGAALAAGSLATGYGVGRGAIKANRAIRSHQGAMNAAFTGTPRTGYLGAASDLAAGKLQAGANLARQGPTAVGQAAMSGLSSAGSTIAKHGSGAFESIMKKIRAFRGK